jgi:hypothetical protein
VNGLEKNEFEKEVLRLGYNLGKEDLDNAFEAYKNLSLSSGEVLNNGDIPESFLKAFGEEGKHQ